MAAENGDTFGGRECDIRPGVTSSAVSHRHRGLPESRFQTRKRGALRSGLARLRCMRTCNYGGTTLKTFPLVVTGKATGVTNVPITPVASS